MKNLLVTLMMVGIALVGTGCGRRRTRVVTQVVEAPPPPPDELYQATAADENQVVNRWLLLAISPSAQINNSWWASAINAVQTQDFEPEIMDAQSGFLRTAWREASYGAIRVRRRFVGNTVSTTPLQWRIRYEVQRLAPGDGDWRDYDRGFRAEMDAVVEIRSRTQAN